MKIYMDRLQLNSARGGEFSFLGHKMLVWYCFLVFMHG